MYRDECERLLGPRDRWELHFPAATGNARLPLVALGPESSGSGSTLALARIHAGAPAQLGHPRGHGTAGNYISQRPLETRGFRWWRSGRNLPARAPPLHSPAFMPAPRLSWGTRGCGKAHRGHQRKEARPCTRSHSCRCARHYGNHIEASNATRPAAVINLN
ncbi:hypothetical protein NDU88_005077 [Pleurodeles waltl]|uniref:Uncharacterized protein n=1 Tax=Pleurodeles waltl TaxID=8319 RepID=A0AAV7RKI9_PLEWA|nr:hypothetical protein NDU88_005077 [Pleurodeles waltl]